MLAAVLAACLLLCAAPMPAAGAKAGQRPMNRAVVFQKPHAHTAAALALTRECLARSGARIVGEREGITGAEILERGSIDAHYLALARAARGGPSPGALAADAALLEGAGSGARAAFSDAFGVALEEAWAAGDVWRADAAMGELGVSAAELEAEWRSGPSVKLAPGCYVGAVAQGGAPRYVLNGFYPSMAERFTEGAARVTAFVVEFDPEVLSWRDFRARVLGATDPDKAEAGSIRSLVLERWEDLGLPERPSTGSNGVHASAGPLEAIREERIWAEGAALEAGEAHPMEEALLDAGASREDLEAWLENADMRYGGEAGPAFDLTEDTDAKDVLEVIRGGLE